MPSTKKYATQAVPVILFIGLLATFLGFYGMAQTGPLTLFDYVGNLSILLLACLFSGGGLWTVHRYWKKEHARQEARSDKAET